MTLGDRQKVRMLLCLTCWLGLAGECLLQRRALDIQRKIRDRIERNKSFSVTPVASSHARLFLFCLCAKNNTYEGFHQRTPASRSISHGWSLCRSLLDSDRGRERNAANLRRTGLDDACRGHCLKGSRPVSLSIGRINTPNFSRPTLRCRLLEVDKLMMVTISHNQLLFSCNLLSSTGYYEWTNKVWRFGYLDYNAHLE